MTTESHDANMTLNFLYIGMPGIHYYRYQYRHTSLPWTAPLAQSTHSSTRAGCSDSDCCCSDDILDIQQRGHPGHPLDIQQPSQH